MPPSTRDPAGRREQIVTAAAELLCAGDGKLTHRRVADHAGVPLGSTTYYFSTLGDLTAAALEHLADQVDIGLAETAELVTGGDATPETVARLFHEYLTDRDRVRVEITIYTAALQRPELVPLTRRWFDGLVEILCAVTDPATAQLLAVFVDGACMHAAVQEQPLELDVLEKLTRTLMGGPGRVTGSERP
ncbi:TetR/AcrR family transcriptional regulator [Gordonia sp. NPDC003376]